MRSHAYSLADNLPVQRGFESLESISIGRKRLRSYNVNSRSVDSAWDVLRARFWEWKSVAYVRYLGAGEGLTVCL